jgi:hypothetical protein
MEVPNGGSECEVVVEGLRVEEEELSERGTWVLLTAGGVWRGGTQWQVRWGHVIANAWGRSKER